MTEEIKKAICTDCGAEFDPDSEGIVLHSGEAVCENCRDGYSYCDESEEWYPEDEVVLAHKRNSGSTIDIYIHKSLISSGDYIETSDGEIWRSEDTHPAHNSRGRSITISIEDYENGDYFTCPDCDEIYHCGYSNYMENLDRQVCNHCSDSYNYCHDCNSYHHNDDGCDCGNDDNCDVIHQYSYKPAPKFRGLGVKRPFLGFENEVEVKKASKSEVAQSAYEYFEDESIVYLKEDSSLNNGFEVVSHPMTLEEHKKLDYSGFLKNLSENGATSHDTQTCGLHVHIDKRRMTDSHKVRFGLVFAVLKSQLEVLARRTENRWAYYKQKDLDRNEYSKSDDRYQAVNWKNENTVEIRIFKGTLKYDTFMASLELCESIYLMTQSENSLNCKIDEKTIWAKLNKYLKKHNLDYPFLIDYIESKKELLDATLKVDELKRQQKELNKKIEDETNKIIEQIA